MRSQWQVFEHVRGWNPLHRFVVDGEVVAEFSENKNGSDVTWYFSGGSRTFISVAAAKAAIEKQYFVADNLYERASDIPVVHSTVQAPVNTPAGGFMFEESTVTGAEGRRDEQYDTWKYDHELDSHEREQDRGG